MDQYVDEASERVADIKAAHAPGLVGRAVFDRQAGGENPAMHLLEILHLDRQIRTGVPDPPCETIMSCGTAAASAAKVTIHPWPMTTRNPRMPP